MTLNENSKDLASKEFWSNTELSGEAPEQAPDVTEEMAEVAAAVDQTLDSIRVDHTWFLND